MHSDQIRGRKAPRFLQAILTSRYGKTPSGTPRYRLVWAPSRYERSGGVWTDWDVTLTAKERTDGSHSPIRRVAEIRWVPKYPGEEAWLIERWLPASSYGTPDHWYRPQAVGGTMIWCGDRYVPACGEYPDRGDYEDIGVRMNWYPSESHLTTAVDAFEQALRNRPLNAYSRALGRTLRAQSEQERRELEFEKLCMDVFDDAAPAFHGAPMIGHGGSHRPALVEMAERIGIREHPL